MIPYQDLNRISRFPIVTVSLILLNLVAFGFELFLPEPAATDWIYRYALIPFEFKIGGNLPISMGPPPAVTILTSMFLHGGFLHLAGNMIYLWIFGDNVEDRMGRIRFFCFYLLCGGAAAATQIYSHFGSKIPTLGASGAIAGVLASYLFQFPTARVRVLIPVFYFLRTVTLPAWIVLGGWIFLQLLSLRLHPQGTGGVALEAHIGGFIAGLLLTPAFRRRRR